MRRSRGLLSFCAVLSVSGGGRELLAYSDIVVFGDSLSDVGNVYAWSFQLKPESPKYWNRRFSNGPVWVEQLATRLGLDAGTPYFDASSPGMVRGGRNYAFGGAHTDIHNLEMESAFGIIGLSSLGRWGMRSQINAHIARGLPASDSLYVLWGGGNDLLDGVSDPWQPVGNLVDDIANLYVYAGAREFLVPNLPPLGSIPRFLNEDGLPKYAPFTDYMNTLAQGFNHALGVALDYLETVVPDARFHRVDVYSGFQGMIANPAAYGITNVTRPGYGRTGGADYLFWDDMHPTTRAHGLIADLAWQSLGVGTSATMSTTPEPATVVLLLPAFVILRGRRGSARRAG